MRRNFYLLVTAAICLSGCGANQSILESGKETPTPPPTAAATAQNDFARDMAEVRNADFTFVYVLRRKDGGPMDIEDRNVIRLNTSDANRRVSTDNDRAFIIGSNVQIQPKNMAALY